MKTIDVLIVVDALGSLAGKLQDNVYLVDTNKHIGSGHEGQAELRTACSDGQLIRWRVEPISPSNDVTISRFTGKMVEQKVCTPKREGSPDDEYWEGRVETQGSVGNYQYSVVLSIDGREQSFDPFLVVT